LTIAQLYRARWKVNCFSLDQTAPAHQGFLRHLGERGEDPSLGGLSVYVLVAIVKKQLGLDLSLYKILQILSVTVSRKPQF